MAENEPTVVERNPKVLAGEGVSLETGREYRVVVKPTGRFLLDVEVMDDPLDDTVKLRELNGPWKQRQKVAEGEEIEEGWIRLTFTGVPEGKTYFCIYDPGAEGEPYHLFEPRELNLLPEGGPQ